MEWQKAAAQTQLDLFGYLFFPFTRNELFPELPDTLFFFLKRYPGVFPEDGRGNASGIHSQGENKIFRFFWRAEPPCGIQHVVEVNPAE